MEPFPTWQWPSEAGDHAGSLKRALGRSRLRAKFSAFLLVFPLLLFVIGTFVVPIGQMLAQSFYNPGFARAVPNLSDWFEGENSMAVPDERAFAALAADFRSMKANKLAGQAGTRINYDYSGARSMFSAAARRVDELRAPYADAFLELDPRWGDPGLWQTMRSAASAFSPDFYLRAMDLERNVHGEIERVSADKRIYGTLFLRTLALSALVTVVCILIAYPVAHLLARLPTGISNLLIILVLLPFWTSLLVRTTSWIVILQTNGVINDALVALGILSQDGRLALIYNQIGTTVAMTHILLPFMILPLYSVMRMIPPSYDRAARSLGATSWTAFRRVYLPQTIPGVAAGSLLVFILAIGYYITPALVGGASGQLISNLIAFHMQTSLNWSLAAALASLLLGGVLVLYWLYDRLVGLDNVKLG